MPSRKFIVLKEDYEEELKLSWRGFFKDIKVSLDDVLLGTIPSRKDLKAGYKIYKDENSYEIKLVTKALSQDFEVLYNGEHVGGSSGDPSHKMKIAVGMIIFLCILNVAIFSISVVGDIESLLKLGFGWYNLIIGVLYFISIITSKKLNRLYGIGCGFSVFLMDTVFALIMISNQVHNAAGGTVIARIIIGAPIFFGLVAAFKSKRNFLEDQKLKYD